MNFSRIVVRRPVAVAMAVLAIVLIGALSTARLELDLLPDMRLAMVGVVTVYPGAAPNAVEGEVTIPVEAALATVNGLKSLESQSVENASIVIATFSPGVNQNQAMNDISSQLAPLAAILPAETIEPVVATLDAGMYSLLTIGVTGDNDISVLTQIAEQQIVPALERLPGVARVNVVAGTRPEISVLFDTQALRANGVPPALLYELIGQQNALVPAGSIEDEGVRYNVRVGNPLTTIDDVRNLVIGQKRTTGLEAAGFAALIPQVLFLKDVASVVEGTSPQQAFARVNGRPAVLLQVYKQSNASSIRVSSAVAEALPGLAESTQAGVELRVLGDQSEFITSSLNDLLRAAILGTILATAVLFLFLRSWRCILVIAISIPLSITVALILMYMGRLTLNVISLGGLALGIGRLVDDSIVVLENIIRHHSMGDDPVEAAAQGTSEVALPIIASTLTTIVVFLPISYLQSTAGQWFRDMAIAVGFALLASLVVATSVVPTVTSKLLSRMRPAHSRDSISRSESTSSFMRNVGSISSHHLQAGYVRALNRVLHRPWATWTLAVCLLFIGALAPKHLPVELLPSMTSSAINVTLRMPAGTPTRETNRLAIQVEQSIAAMDGVASVWATVGQQDDDVLQLLSSAGGHVAQIHVLLKPATERGSSTLAIADHIRQLTAGIDLAGGHLSVSSERMTDSLGTAYSSGATIQIQGPNLSVLESLASDLAQSMRQDSGFTEVSCSVDDRQPELLLTVDRTKALLGSLTTKIVGINLRGALTGLEATRIHRDGTSIPVVLRPQPEEIASLSELLELPIQGIATDGQSVAPSVRVGRVVTTTQATGPVAIQHIDRMRTIAVTARLAGIDLGTAQQRAEELIASLDLPPGTSARLAGVHETLREAVSELWLVLAIAVVLVYMVMAVQFESVLYPLVIMATVPLGIAGGLLSLWLTGQSLGVSAIMGLIILTGVATSNGIILVDAANRFRQAGVPGDQAILLAADRRMRPILMNSLTTIIGLVPLAIGTGEGTELQRPLSIAYMGGMLFSTVLTLFVVPVAYEGLARRSPAASQPVPVTVITHASGDGA